MTSRTSSAPGPLQWDGRSLRTYFGHLQAALAEADDDSRPAVADLRRRVSETLGDGRQFVNLEERLGDRTRRSDLDRYTFMLSQGTRAPMTWLGGPMYKSVFDLGVYTQLIQDLQPATIVELGSGSGASAGWMAAMANLVQPDPFVVSVDQNPPTHPASGVRYVTGDATDLRQLLGHGFFADLPRPLLIVEDVHVPLGPLLDHLLEVTQAGDYVVIEDSGPKEEELRQAANKLRDRWLVDTWLTDFFGHNATSARDSIFKVMR